MERISFRLPTLGMMVWVGLCALAPSESAAQHQSPPFWGTPASPAGPKPSITDSISSTLKKGADSLGQMLAPKPRVEPADDPTSLRTRAKPGPELYVSVARLYAESGRPAEAAQQYEKALKLAPNHVGALLGYARLKDRLGEPDQAQSLYQRAAGSHPNEAAVHNNLALFYARRGRLNESLAALGRAIRLQPNNPKYRNNIATVLVEMGRPREAFVHLHAVHGEAVAYYNLGYLLERKGQLESAAQHFVVALQKDPSLVPARRGLERLRDAKIQTPVATGPPSSGVRIGNRPVPPTQQTYPATPVWRRPVAPPATEKPRRDVPSPGSRRPFQPPQRQGLGPTSPDSSSTPRLPPIGRPPVDVPRAAPLPKGNPIRTPVPTAPLPPASGPSRLK